MWLWPSRDENTCHVSDLAPWPSWLTTSGAIQYGVPLMDRRTRGLGLSAVTFRTSFLAQPKSISLITPSGISITLPPFISLKNHEKQVFYTSSQMHWTCTGRSTDYQVNNTPLFLVQMAFSFLGFPKSFFVLMDIVTASLFLEFVSVNEVSK